MKKLLLFCLLLQVSSHGWAQPTGPDLYDIDSLICITHHTSDLAMVRVDTNYLVQSKWVEEHYFIDTAGNVLERAVVQVFHSPSASTLEYYFFLGNTLARVQTQEINGDEIGNARIYYFVQNTPLDCQGPDKALCDQFVHNAPRIVKQLNFVPS